MSLPIESITNPNPTSTPDTRRKPIIIGLFVLFILVVGSFFAIKLFNNKKEIVKPVEKTVVQKDEKTDEDTKTKVELAKLTSAANEKSALTNSKKPGDVNDKTKPFNILILGIDRRSGDQTHWRTDVIQLATISKDRTHILLTHIPRDVWAGSYKINALYNLQGPEAIKDKIEEITGQRPDRIIRFDFDAFVWAVDAVGGITVNVERAFTDEGYPDDRNGNQEIKTISFEAGEQTMDGETALMYARSRKGTNGEGSDYARGTRQQIVMESILKDFFTKETLFKPKTAETVYKLATQKVYTDFTLTDTKVLYEVAKNYENIKVTKLSLDTTNYLVTPKDRTAYGGAWTLIAKDGTYAPLHNEINNLIQ